MELTNYKISKHAMERYCSRIMNKDNMSDINRLIKENEEKIKTDINKLITYGECIFQGKQSQKDGKGKVLDVFLKDTWIVLVDIPAATVVTLYKVDLGCGDEFNLEYINKMLEKINEYKNQLNECQISTELENKQYKDFINEAQCQINEYKSIIKNLEEMCNGYQTIINNNIVKVSIANKNVADTVNTLVGKKEF